MVCGVYLRDTLKYDSNVAGSSHARVISSTASFVSDLIAVSTVIPLVGDDASKRVGSVATLEQPASGVLGVGNMSNSQNTAGARAHKKHDQTCYFDAH